MALPYGTTGSLSPAFAPENDTIIIMYYQIVLDIHDKLSYTYRKKEEKMYTTIVTTKGQIVIPSKIRRRMNLKKGSKLLVEEKENEIILRPLTQAYFSSLSGKISTKGKLSELLLKKRKEQKQDK